MKIKNLFKKSTKTVTKGNVEKLEKNQLEKVVGGLDEIEISSGISTQKTTPSPGRPVLQGIRN